MSDQSLRIDARVLQVEGRVVISFGRPIDNMVMRPEDASGFAASIAAAADALQDRAMEAKRGT